MEMRSRSFGYRFAMLYRLHASLSREALQKLGIARSQVPLIAELLIAEGPLTQDQLSDRLAIDKAATARGLERLEKKGLVYREVNPRNRRQKLARPTEKTRKMAEPFFTALRSASEVFVKGFTEKERVQALDLMDRMMQNARDEKYGCENPEPV